MTIVTDWAESPQASSKPVVEVKGISKWYGDVQVLDDCSLRILPKEVVVVCGPSGSGKSTLIRCLNGLERVQKGEITVDGMVVTSPNCDLDQLRRRIGMVFQSFDLFPHMSVLENIALAQRVVLRRTPEVAESRSLQLLDRMGLKQHAAKPPEKLSGGQQQRVAIARALALDPKVLLFDEPTSALDPEMIKEVLDVMVGLARDGMTMFVVTHEMGFARKVADRVIFMDQGKIAEDSPKDQFFPMPRQPRAQQFLSNLISH